MLTQIKFKIQETDSKRRLNQTNKEMNQTTRQAEQQPDSIKEAYLRLRDINKYCSLVEKDSQRNLKKYSETELVYKTKSTEYDQRKTGRR